MAQETGGLLEGSPLGTGLPESLRKIEQIGIFSLQKHPELDSSERAFKINRARITLGSVESADVRLPFDGVSPIHALVLFNHGQAKIFDLVGQGGVFVNGQKVEISDLKSGDRIRLGNEELLFQIDSVQKLTSPYTDEIGRKLFSVYSPEEKHQFLQDPDEVHAPVLNFSESAYGALEVVMVWNGLVIDVGYFQAEKEVTLGAAVDNHFVVALQSQAKRHVFFKKTGSRYSLGISQEMQGVLFRAGRLQKLTELTSSLMAQEGNYHVTFEKDDFAKICIGEIEFYVSYNSAPPKTRRKKVFENDPFYFRIMSSAVLIGVFLMIAMYRMQVVEQIEIEKLPDRVATIIYQPEKYSYKYHSEPTEPQEKRPTPKPPVGQLDLTKVRPKAIKQQPEMNVGKKTADQSSKQGAKASGKAQQAQNQAKEGAGARAKGTQGTRGSKTAKATGTPQNQAFRPSPGGGKGRGAGKSQVPDVGNVDVLKGFSEKFQDLLGNSAAKLGKAGNQLKGYGGFDTQSEGGLALSGSGKGGGGDSELLGGLADKGRGGGRVGTGLGAAGEGNEIVGGKSRVLLRTGGPEETVVMGAIDAGAVEAAILAHKDEFRYCYEKEINAGQPDLKGRVLTGFVIGSAGRVTEAGVVSSSLRSENVEGCVLEVLRRIQFPRPKGGGVVEVKYAFKYRPVGT